MYDSPGSGLDTFMKLKRVLASGQALKGSTSRRLNVSCDWNCGMGNFNVDLSICALRPKSHTMHDILM